MFIGKDGEDKNQGAKDETRRSRSMEENKRGNGVDWVCCIHQNAAPYHQAADNRTQCTCDHNRCANCPRVIALPQGRDLGEYLHSNGHPQLKISDNRFYSVSWVCFRSPCLKLRQCTCPNPDRRIVLLLGQ
jgi:hypothetical protein